MEQERRRRSERIKTERRYESSHEERTMEPETKHGEVVNCVCLNFRSTPTRNDLSNVIDTIPKGEIVQINKTVGDMLDVTLKDGRNGFIAAAYCKEV